MLSLLAWLALAPPAWKAPVGSLVVTSVTWESLVKESPLQPGDQLLTVNGTAPSSNCEIELRRGNHEYDETVEIAYIRDGKRQVAKVDQFWRIKIAPVLDAQSKALAANHKWLVDFGTVPTGASAEKDFESVCDWARSQPLAIRGWFVERLSNSGENLRRWNAVKRIAIGDDFLTVYIYESGARWGTLTNPNFSEPEIRGVASVAAKRKFLYSQASILALSAYRYAYVTGELERALPICRQVLAIQLSLKGAEEGALNLLQLQTYLQFLLGRWADIRKSFPLGERLAGLAGSSASGDKWKLWKVASDYQVEPSAQTFDDFDKEIRSQISAYDAYADLNTIALHVFVEASIERSKIPNALRLLNELRVKAAKEEDTNVSTLRDDRMFAIYQLGRVNLAAGDAVGVRQCLLDLKRADGNDDYPDYRAESLILEGDLAAAEGRLKEADKAYRLAQGILKKLEYTMPFTSRELDKRLKGHFRPNPIRSVSAAPSPSPSAMSLADGQGYAVFFVTDEYAEWPQLRNPILDGKALGEELEALYGFKVQIVENATKDRIFEVLTELSKRKFEPQDQLLVFFGGHGLYESNLFRDGMIVCADSKKTDPSRSTYLTRDSLTRLLDNLKCGHVCLMLDVCFGGGFSKQIEGERAGTRGLDTTPTAADEERLRRSVKWVTRKFLASGADQPVSDGVPGRNSPFVRKLLEVFRTVGLTKAVLSFEDLLGPIMQIQGQTPVYMDFGTYDPGSSFFFIRKRSASEPGR